MLRVDERSSDCYIGFFSVYLRSSTLFQLSVGYVFITFVAWFLRCFTRITKFKFSGVNERSEDYFYMA